MNWKIMLADLDFGEEEVKAVTDVIRSGWVTMGERTAQFEREFGEMTGSRYAVAVSSATA